METQLPELSEYDLMLAARTDLRQFAPLYERYFPRIYAYCLRRVSNAQEAEDLTSTIFTRAMTSIEQYRGGLVAAWLFRIAHNTVVNHLKGRRVNVSLNERSNLPQPNPSDPLDRLIRAEEEQTIRDLLATLSDEQQDLLLLQVVGGLSAEEIGKLIGKRAGAVRVAIHRILKQLYREYQRKGGASHA